MEKALICPRTEICYVYRIYTDNTKDDSLGIVKVLTIEHREHYSCQALSVVMKLANEGKLSEEIVKRLQGIFGCFLIDQANKSTGKRRMDS